MLTFTLIGIGSGILLGYGVAKRKPKSLAHPPSPIVRLIDELQYLPVTKIYHHKSSRCNLDLEMVDKILTIIEFVEGKIQIRVASCPGHRKKGWLPDIVINGALYTPDTHELGLLHQLAESKIAEYGSEQITTQLLLGSVSEVSRK